MEIQPDVLGISPYLEFSLESSGKILQHSFGTTRAPVPVAKFTFLDPEAEVQYFAGTRRIGHYTFQRDSSIKPFPVQMVDQFVGAESGADLFVFYCQKFLGRSMSGKFRIDARRLVPGYHEFFTVQRLEANKYGPLTMSKIWIPARLQIDAPEGTVAIEGNTSFATVKVRSLSKLALKEFRFFLGGRLIAVQSQDPDTFREDGSYVPTGTHLLDVVAVCTDSVPVAAESVTIRIANPLLDAERARSERLRAVETLIARVTKLDETVVALYERALKATEMHSIRSARFLTVSEWGHSASLGLIESWQVPGDAGRLLGECRSKILERTNLSIDIGKLFARLGRLPEARTWLQFALDSVGANRATGVMARSELAKLAR